MTELDIERVLLDLTNDEKVKLLSGMFDSSMKRFGIW